MSEDQAHELTIVPRPKMDAERLVVAKCSCGYRSAPGGQHDVMRAFQAHVRGKADYEERRGKR